tara:strand:- start:3211 stop:3396 length:186 start_codon:yes stop_codon:yes gene_type:complete
MKEFNKIKKLLEELKEIPIRISDDKWYRYEKYQIEKIKDFYKIIGEIEDECKKLGVWGSDY